MAPATRALLVLLAVVGVFAGITSRPAAAAKRYVPVLAFYYPWYSAATWCRCHMRYLPIHPYVSSATSTIDRQLEEAAYAGIDGFISSWWGRGNQTDVNFAHLLRRAALLERRLGYHFTSTIYLETDSPLLNTQSKLVAGLRYVLRTYASSRYFFHWRGRPVIFVWDPLGGHRTLAMWKRIRREVDPRHRTLWSAEGTNIRLLQEFDGLQVSITRYYTHHLPR